MAKKLKSSQASAKCMSSMPKANYKHKSINWNWQHEILLHMVLGHLSGKFYSYKHKNCITDWISSIVFFRNRNSVSCRKAVALPSTWILQDYGKVNLNKYSWKTVAITITVAIKYVTATNFQIKSQGTLSPVHVMCWYLLKLTIFLRPEEAMLIAWQNFVYS